MKSFKTHQQGVSIISPNADITQMLDKLGVQYKFEEDYLLIRDISRETVQDLVDNFPYDVDYEIYAHIQSDLSDDEVFLGDEESEFIDLYSGEHGDYNEFTVIVYLYNMYFDEIRGTDVNDVKGDHVADGQLIGEVRRQVKVNAKGKRRIKMKCRKGFKWTGGKCEKISGSEKSNKRRSIRKAVRTKKAKGSGFLRMKSRKTKKAMRKRKSMGLGRR